MKKGIIIGSSMLIMGCGLLLRKDSVSAEENNKEIQSKETLIQEEDDQGLNGYDVVSTQDNSNKYVYKNGKLEKYSEETKNDGDLLISTDEFKEGDHVDITVEDKVND